MDAAPGKVIRSLRQALNMSQAEFARAAGWSPSTISSWERGTSRPSRLAFKTILAFAEERGVRYQPKGDTPSAPPGTLPVLRMPSRMPAPAGVEILAPEPARASRAREESFGSRRWTEVAASGVATTFDAPAGTRRHESAWQAEATLHVKIGGGKRPSSSRAGYVVAAAAALVIGLGVGTMLRERPRVSDGVSAARPAAEAVASTEPAVDDDGAIDAPDVAADALPGDVADAAAGDQPFPSGVAEPAPVAAGLAPAPAALLARLESIVSLDGVRRASFRVGDRTIALVEGDQLGARAVAKIANEDVTLVGGDGGARRIQLGFETPLD